ncbi:hypothetical protein GOP47_0018304 [Adiantum capillus-veneris]|uniref:Uncharacterized protein n=1 Tax=Adiantum capillus-veneris TaxID=13818 RepID=A0A9D4UH24_ADICA|nr:hypothetical protein GOP47_0018304 [Adiantum capillus-veneris]
MNNMAAAYHASFVQNFGSDSIEQLQQLVAAQIKQHHGTQRQAPPSAAAGHNLAAQYVAGADIGRLYVTDNYTPPVAPSNFNLAGVLPLGATSLLAAVLAAAPPIKTTGVEPDVPTPTTLHRSDVLAAGSLVRGNVCSAVDVFLRWPGHGTSDRYMISDFWTSEEAAYVAYGERLLQVPETAFKLVSAPGSGDYAALRYLAKAVQKNMSAAEMARALQEEAEGRQCLETFHTSPTFGAVVSLASWWWDDVVDWLKGAVQWVADSVSAFGEWATKQARALIDNVFSRYEGLVHVLEEVPGIGLGVAAIYAVAGDHDHAMAALAINLNGIVTVAATSIGFVLGGPAGAMAGGAIGKAAGLGIQIGLSHFIHDPKLRSEVGDISATRFIIDVFLAGAAYGGSVGVAKTLATQLGYGFVKKFGLSITLAALLSELPNALT